jgi:hypothetical protein
MIRALLRGVWEKGEMQAEIRVRMGEALDVVAWGGGVRVWLDWYTEWKKGKTDRHG